MKARETEVGFPQSFADLVATVKPAVVNISATTTVKIPGGPFRHFLVPMRPYSDKELMVTILQ